MWLPVGGTLHRLQDARLMPFLSSECNLEALCRRAERSIALEEMGEVLTPFPLSKTGNSNRRTDRSRWLAGVFEQAVPEGGLGPRRHWSPTPGGGLGRCASRPCRDVGRPSNGGRGDRSIRPHARRLRRRVPRFGDMRRARQRRHRGDLRRAGPAATIAALAKCTLREVRNVEVVMANTLCAYE